MAGPIFHGVGLPVLEPNGRLMSIFSFDLRPMTFFARMSSSVKRASKISPSVARLRS